MVSSGATLWLKHAFQDILLTNEQARAREVCWLRSSLQPRKLTCGATLWWWPLFASPIESCRLTIAHRKKLRTQLQELHRVTASACCTSAVFMTTKVGSASSTHESLRPESIEPEEKQGRSDDPVSPLSGLHGLSLYPRERVARTALHARLCPTYESSQLPLEDKRSTAACCFRSCQNSRGGAGAWFRRGLCRKGDARTPGPQGPASASAGHA